MFFWKSVLEREVSCDWRGTAVIDDAWDVLIGLIRANIPECYCVWHVPYFNIFEPDVCNYVQLCLLEMEQKWKIDKMMQEKDEQT
jgi:hypothetical protein